MQKKDKLPDYQAFDAKDKNKRLTIRHSSGTWHSPAYAYLLDIVSDGERGKEISLIYSFMVVNITGRNLYKLAIALQNNECDFIQDYDPQAFAEPQPDEVFIESIEIVTGEKN